MVLLGVSSLDVYIHVVISNNFFQWTKCQSGGMYIEWRCFCVGRSDIISMVNIWILKPDQIVAYIKWLTGYIPLGQCRQAQAGGHVLWIGEHCYGYDHWVCEKLICQKPIQCQQNHHEIARKGCMRTTSQHLGPIHEDRLLLSGYWVVSRLGHQPEVGHFGFLICPHPQIITYLIKNSAL